ncbi:hypothetical protein [Candidatus Nanohalovita haloferacivicina]|uniref:hypothetical protein n=1 Tax=Candidatus Nanohalovita haloferacivicina TaxID=2978046 RepID=UPI00325FCF1E|nr:hypothetical protein HBNXNv_0933 [Candidatus Nanohalobia archaeon BNXNv]
MIANFSDDTGELYVFFDEGELENLDEGPVTGSVADADNRDLGAGDMYVSYEEDLHFQRPVVGREVENGDIGDFEVVLGENVYDKLLDGEVYEFPGGRYHSIPQGAEVKLMPYGENGGMDQLYSELDELR